MQYEIHITVSTGNDSSHGKGLAAIGFSIERYGYGSSIRGVVQDDLDSVHSFILNNIEQAVNLSRIKATQELVDEQEEAS